MAIELDDTKWLDERFGARFRNFQNLMQRRVRDVLLVSSLYDLYLFEEDGRLYELLQAQNVGSALTRIPEITRTSNGSEALARMASSQGFDLIITTLHIEDMSVLEFVQKARERHLNVPVVLLAFDNRELQEFIARHDLSIFDGVYVWQGDIRLILSIISQVEDRLNVAHDTASVGVQSIILVEDSVSYYSTFLPLIYQEILNQSYRLIQEGINLSHKFLRLRARPKILLCRSYEEAWEAFSAYEEEVLGIISDIDFPRNGSEDGLAGIQFATMVRERHRDIAILLQSTSEAHRPEAEALGVGFLLKGSPTLLRDLRRYMIEYFSFGEFVFRMPNGDEVGRANDLRTLERVLRTCPEESLTYHAERNHFSNWLKARTEFDLAHSLRPRQVSDYASVEDLRQDLITAMRDYRHERQRGSVTYFSKETYMPSSSFARIGGGSLGGKARGLGFILMLLSDHNIRRRYEGLKVFVPPGVALGTDIYDQFVDENGLRNFALQSADDGQILRRFLDATAFPEGALRDLEDFLDLVRDPLAVRSSSLLEDSQYFPFAGIYDTFMIPNSDPDPAVRLRELITAIKTVYASTYFGKSKEYMRHTSYRLEEEKMGVIVQRLVGARHAHRYYPDFSGVARSHNFYPISPQKASDGIASVALGLGKTIVDGGMVFRFCPKYPEHAFAYGALGEMLRHRQSSFFALDMGVSHQEEPDSFVRPFTLEDAEGDNVLKWVGSTYSHENDRLTDGLARDGIRLVTFGPVLRGKQFPLASIIDVLLRLGTRGMGTPVEIEFAVTMSTPEGQPREFAVLQMRPLVVSTEGDYPEVNDDHSGRVFARSTRVLGNGVIDEIHDIVFVDPGTFDRSKTRDVAKEVERLNARLVQESRPYLLIGMGRWGSLDPWLGIPVRWEQIAGVRTIVEAAMPDVDVTPSEGSHFFHNITSFQVGYFTVQDREDNHVDWEWLRQQPIHHRSGQVGLVRFDRPLRILMNGKNNRGVILKPAAD